jgi:hypothetical protein
MRTLAPTELLNEQGFTGKTIRDALAEKSRDWIAPVATTLISVPNVTGVAELLVVLVCLELIYCRLVRILDFLVFIPESIKLLFHVITPRASQWTEFPCRG